MRRRDCFTDDYVRNARSDACIIRYFTSRRHVFIDCRRPLRHALRRDLRKNIGSLADFNISFDKIDLKNGAFDEENIIKTIEKTRPKMVFIQRSRGYSWRDALSIDAISDIIRKIRQKIRILSLPSTTVTASLSIILNRQTSARTLS